MKSIVIYFSQTGNTQKVAERIRNGIREVTGNCELAPLKSTDPHQLCEYDLIGLGCPVFDYEEPLNVRRFINSLRSVGGKHAFVFSTHGCLPEYFFPSVVPRLQRRGLLVIGMRDWYSKVYLAPMPDPYPTEGHPDLIDLMEAEAFGREMAEHSARISLGEAALIPSTPISPLEPPPSPHVEEDDPMLEGLQWGDLSRVPSLHGTVPYGRHRSYSRPTGYSQTVYKMYFLREAMPYRCFRRPQVGQPCGIYGS